MQNKDGSVTEYDGSQLSNMFSNRKNKMMLHKRGSSVMRGVESNDESIS